MKKTLINIAERAVSTALFSYASASAVLAGGFGTRHDLQIAEAAGLFSLVKNVAAVLANAGNGPDPVPFNDGGADVAPVEQADPGVVPPAA